MPRLDHAQLLQHLRRFVLAEAGAARRHLARQWALPLGKRLVLTYVGELDEVVKGLLGGGG